MGFSTRCPVQFASKIEMPKPVISLLTPKNIVPMIVQPNLELSIREHGAIEKRLSKKERSGEPIYSLLESITI